MLALTLGVGIGADFCLILTRVLGGALGLLWSILRRRGLSAGLGGRHFGRVGFEVAAGMWSWRCGAALGELLVRVELLSLMSVNAAWKKIWEDLIAA